MSIENAWDGMWVMAWHCARNMPLWPHTPCDHTVSITLRYTSLPPEQPYILRLKCTYAAFAIRVRHSQQHARHHRTDLVHARAGELGGGLLVAQDALLEGRGADASLAGALHGGHADATELELQVGVLGGVARERRDDLRVGDRCKQKHAVSRQAQQRRGFIGLQRTISTPPTAASE